MKRDPRLCGLSSDHHHALVLARTVSRRAADGTADLALARLVAERFQRELEPHFLVEEELLVPALRAAGKTDLVSRLEEDHAFLRAQISAAAERPFEHLSAFAARLAEHVRFEERVLFPVCETDLAAEVLEEIGRRAPSKKSTDPRAER